MPIFGYELLWLFLFFLPSGGGISAQRERYHAMQNRCMTSFPFFIFTYLPITA